MCIHRLEMKLLISVVSLIGIINAHFQYPQPLWNEAQVIHNYYEILQVPCNIYPTSEGVLDFRKALYETITILFRKTVALSDAHFALSPLSIWQALAAIAEGSEGETKRELYRILGLPEDRCARELYYNLASTREPAGDDVVLDRKRLFITDSGVFLNKEWENFVESQHLTNVASLPFKSEPSISIQSWQQTFSAQLPNINLNGNSVILESLDYNGLWTSAFSDATIVKEPFYNTLGEKIASMEFMKIRKSVRIAYMPAFNIKILELPVGKDGRFRMFFAVTMGQGSFRSSVEVLESSFIFETLKRFVKSAEPIDVMIPRITMTSEVDVRRVLEEIGIKALWTDPYDTRNISEPAALPSSYIQRTTINLDKGGIRPHTQEYSNIVPPVPSNGTGLDPAVGQDFVVNRPFLFGLFDSETFMCLFASSFSNPN